MRLGEGLGERMMTSNRTFRFLCISKFVRATPLFSVLCLAPIDRRAHFEFSLLFLWHHDYVAKYLCSRQNYQWFRSAIQFRFIFDVDSVSCCQAKHHSPRNISLHHQVRRIVSYLDGIKFPQPNQWRSMMNIHFMLVIEKSKSKMMRNGPWATNEWISIVVHDALFHK